jgi:nanoRNase/pAp phosphatase (c-di-AMP/oligoRNAs hydrolase)
MENLCVLAMKRDSEIRVSCRSHKLCKEASALEFARIFEGGGHKEAAGFKMSCNKFKSCFKVHALSKFGININLEVD